MAKLGIAFLIFICTFRINVGADFLTYKNYFYMIQNNLLVDNQMDLGYYFLNKIIAYFGLPFSFLLFIIACFNMISLYLFVKKYCSKNQWIAIFSYLSIFEIFIYSLSAIRQSIALSILLLSYKYIEEQNTKKVYLILLVASFFHWSCIFLIPFYHLFCYINSKSLFKIFLIFVIITMLYPIAIQIMRMFPINYNIDYYLNIHNNSNIYSSSKINVLILFIIVWFLLMFLKKNIFYYKGKIIIKNFISKSSEFSLKYSEYSLLMYFLTRIWMTISYNPGIARIQMFFFLFIPFLINDWLYELDNKTEFTIKIIIVILLISRLILSIIENYEFYGSFSLLL